MSLTSCNPGCVHAIDMLRRCVLASAVKQPRCSLTWMLCNACLASCPAPFNTCAKAWLAHAQVPQGGLAADAVAAAAWRIPAKHTASARDENASMMGEQALLYPVPAIHDADKQA